MIRLNSFKGFSLQIGDNSPEAKQLHLYCLINDIEIKRYAIRDNIPIDYVPCGSVKYCEKVLGKHIIPDYYPDWLTAHLYRKVWKSREWITGERYFIKPADKHKRFNGFITSGPYSKKKKPPFWYSEIVSFKNEWRYYISNGKNLGGWWYQGEAEEMLSPNLNISIKDGFCGTLDFGMTNKNEFALVEAHPPYACGWYGSQDEVEIYLQWMINGWEYLNE